MVLDYFLPFHHNPSNLKPLDASGLAASILNCNVPSLPECWHLLLNGWKRITDYVPRLRRRHVMFYQWDNKTTGMKNLEDF